MKHRLRCMVQPVALKRSGATKGSWCMLVQCHGIPNRRSRWPQVVADLSNRISDTGRCPWLPADLLRVLPVLAMNHSMSRTYISPFCWAITSRPYIMFGKFMIILYLQGILHINIWTDFNPWGISHEWTQFQHHSWGGEKMWFGTSDPQPHPSLQNHWELCKAGSHQCEHSAFVKLDVWHAEPGKRLTTGKWWVLLRLLPLFNHHVPLLYNG